MRWRLRLPVYSPRRHRRRPLMTTARCSADIFIATTISRPVSRTARRLPVWMARAKTTRCLSLRKRTNSPSVTTAIAVTSGSAVWLAVVARRARGCDTPAPRISATAPRKSMTASGIFVTAPRISTTVPRISVTTSRISTTALRKSG